MPRAIWNNQIIAKSDETQVVEGNHYFPRESIVSEFFEPSDHITECGWKGTASYLHVVVEDRRNENAAWYYEEPKAEAENIANHVAFWKGVQIES